MILRVLLFDALGSASHSFICRMAISLVEGLSKKVANNLIASKPIHRNQMENIVSLIYMCKKEGNDIPTGVLGESVTSDKMMWYCPSPRYDLYMYSSFSCFNDAFTLVKAFASFMAACKVETQTIPLLTYPVSQQRREIKQYLPGNFRASKEYEA